MNFIGRVITGVKDNKQHIALALKVFIPTLIVLAIFLAVMTSIQIEPQEATCHDCDDTHLPHYTSN